MQEIEEFKLIAEAEDVEVSLIRDTLANLIDDQFIASATENGIARRENMLKIQYQTGDTVEMRRQRVDFYWINQLPYTDRRLEARLNSVAGQGNYIIEKDYGNYAVTVYINLVIKTLLGEAERAIKSMIPANMVFTILLKYNLHANLSEYTHGQLGAYTHFSLREDPI